MKTKYLLLLLLCFFTLGQKAMADDEPMYNVNSRLGDSLMEKIPQDTILRFIKRYGKDSLIHLLDEKIELAATYMKSGVNMIESPTNLLQLKMVDKKFKLGLDNAIARFDSIAEPGYFRLYGDYNKGISKLGIMDTISMDKHFADSMMQQTINQRGIRGIIVTFCHQMPWSQKVINDMYAISNMTIQLRNEIYWQYYEMSYKGCKGEYPAYFDSVRAILTKDIRNIATYQDTVFLKDQTNYIEPLKSLTYGLYANEISIKDGSPIVFLMSLQQPDGGFPKNLLEEYSQAISTVFGLWALCEVREECRQLKD